MQYFDKFIDVLYSEYGDYLKNQNKKDIIRFYKSLVDKIYIALSNKQFIGCYLIKSCFISDVYVIPKFRNKGLGRILLDDARKRQVCFKYELYSDKKNVGFYHKLGYKIKDAKNSKKVLMVSYNMTMISLIFALIIGLVVYISF
jgi:GNAT superfamily N-acetyltransferase